MREPSSIAPLELRATPLEVAARWPVDRPLVMLHSGRVHRRWARWSILASLQATYRFHDGRSQLTGHTLCETVRGAFVDDPLVDLQTILTATRVDPQPLGSSGPPFRGGWIGYLSYDLLAHGGSS